MRVGHAIDKAWLAGAQADVTITVEVPKPTKIRFIDVRLVGEQGWREGLGKESARVSIASPDLTLRVMDAGLLAPGTRRFPASFALPAGLPPTHAHGPAWASLGLEVRVGIPWWRDHRQRFNLPLRIPPPRAIERSPVTARSGVAPGLEVTLASAHLVAGEAVSGTCMLFKHDEPRDIELHLVSTVKLLGAGPVARLRSGGTELTATVTLPGGGTPVRFELQLPPAITPSFAATTHELSWSLVVFSGRMHGGRIGVEVPVTIHDAGAVGR